MNRFQFVADHRHAFEVKRLCEVVEVSRSSFYAWLNATDARAAKAAEDTALAEQIRVLQDPAQGGDRAYGAPRITAELNDGAPAEKRVNHISAGVKLGKSGHAVAHSSRGNTREIRAWAAENGFEVSSRGRVPGRVAEAYQAAN